MLPSNLTEYLELFSSVREAIEFEEACLSIGDEYLPQLVKLVRDCEAVPTYLYWNWLGTQLAGSNDTRAPA